MAGEGKSGEKRQTQTLEDEKIEDTLNLGDFLILSRLGKESLQAESRQR
jgi:hypothetical protein